MAFAFAFTYLLRLTFPQNVNNHKNRLFTSHTTHTAQPHYSHYINYMSEQTYIFGEKTTHNRNKGGRRKE